MKHNTGLKRIVSLILSTTMCLSLLVPNVWAAESLENADFFDQSGQVEDVGYHEELIDDDSVEAEEDRKTQDSEKQFGENGTKVFTEFETQAAATGTCGDNVKWSFDDSTGILTISGTGDMEDYDGENAAPWGNSGIRQVVIEPGITSIGDHAFHSSSHSLRNVIIPNSITSIGISAFHNCYNLKDLIIPNSVTIIGNNAFDACRNLTSVTIPNSVTSIGRRAFAFCTKLDSITLSNSLKSIGPSSFLSCENITSVIIPDSVTNIEECAFASCKKLTNLTISNNVMSIGNRAFLKCSGLSNVTIPNGVQSIGKEVFAECDNLTSVTIPNSVMSVGEGAFRKCSSLDSVTIPNDVSSIEGEVFKECSSLTSVTIPNSVVSIGNRAFQKCNRLREVIIPNGVKSIGNFAFFCCSNLKSVKIPKSVTSIGTDAFGIDTGRTMVDGFSMLGYSESAAEKYAQRKGISFVPLNDEKSIQELNKELAEKVETVEKDSTKVEEVVSDLKNKDEGLFCEAVTTNQETHSIVERLEKVYSEEKNIEVEVKTDKETLLSEDELKIVGAAFNAKPGARKVTVEITKPEQIGRLHDSGAKSLQEIGINIYSDNEKVEELDIPVAVTIPVPKNADVKKIKIYNFFSGNRIETMTPSVVTVNKTKMLRFATKNPKDIVIATLVSAQKKYTVTLNANGGKMKVKKKTVKKTTIKLKKGAKYGKLPKPTRKKYKFQGWYTDKKKGKKVTAKTKMNTAKNTTLYARWKKQ